MYDYATMGNEGLVNRKTVVIFRCRYLQEAIMNLDASNPLTKEHMPSVIQSLCVKLVDYINHHPSGKMTKQMRMLLMASQSLHKVNLSQPR